MSDGDAIDALEQALALRAAPGRASMLRKRALPDNVLLLIRIVAGDRKRLDGAVRRTGETANAVLEAAQLYVQQILLIDDADPYRILGVPCDASDDTIKAHYRSLMVWLHPDRDPDRWETGFADRVNGAWRAIGSAERRAQYDAQRRAGMASSQKVKVTGSVARTRPTVIDLRESKPPRARPNLRWVPFAGVGALMVLAALVVGVSYELRVRAPNPVTGDVPPSSDRSSVPPLGVVDAETSPAAPPAVASLPIASGAEPSRIADEHADMRAGSVGAAGGADRVPVQPPLAVASASSPVPAQDAVGPSLRGVRAEGIAVVPNAQLRPRSATVPAGLDRQAALAVVPQAARGRSGASELEASRGVLTGSKAPVASPVIVRESPSVRALDRSPLAARVSSASAGSILSAAPEQATANISPREGAAAISNAFVGAYADGNLPRLMRLFAPTAVNDRGGIEAIAADYAEFFVSSRSRTLRWQPVSWDFRPDRIVGVGPFDARVVRKGDLFAYEVRGWMRIEAVPIGGVWKIQRIQHGNSQ